MKLLLTFGLTMVALNAQAGSDVVYGQDNRLDVYQANGAQFKRFAKASAAMIGLRHFEKNSSGTFDLKNIKTLEASQNVCHGELFSQQPAAAVCSGFLVGPDTLITAGHCYKQMGNPEDVCKSFAWVFDYEMKTPTSDPTKNIPLSNVYLCKTIVAAELSETADYAVIKLDRRVIGRDPVKYRTSGKVSDHAKLVVIGNPTGLPTKVSPGGKVTRNVDPTRFSTNLDTFHGNSGSAVFHDNTGVVEGILIQGKADYVPSDLKDPRSCQVVNKCDDNGGNCIVDATVEDPTTWGEVVLRIDQLLPAIQKSLELK